MGKKKTAAPPPSLADGTIDMYRTGAWFSARGNDQAARLTIETDREYDVDGTIRFTWQGIEDGWCSARGCEKRHPVEYTGRVNIPIKLLMALLKLDEYALSHADEMEQIRFRLGETDLNPGAKPG